MNKILAKVKLLSGKNVEHLIKGFFRNFNPENSINIKGNQALLEINFDSEPPIEVIDAMSFCQVEEFIYGKKLDDGPFEGKFEEKNEEEQGVTSKAISKEEESNQIQDGETNEEGNSQAKPAAEKKRRGRTAKKVTKKKKERTVTSTKTKRSKKDQETLEAPVVATEKKRRGRPPKKTAEGEDKKEVSNDSTKEAVEEKVVKVVSKLVPELNEMAANASSVEEFAVAIAKLLEMKERTEFFKNLVLASMQLDKISWLGLENTLKSNMIKYTNWDKIWAGKQVTEKLKDRSITILKLLEQVSLFKDYWTESKKRTVRANNQKKEDQPVVAEEKKEEPVVTEEKKEETVVVEEKEDSSTKKPRIKMECMPEIKEFEEVLASLDKAQAVEKRIIYVFEAMGFEKLPSETKNQILAITKTALAKQKISLDRILVETNISVDKTLEARMEFSKFINDFASKYEKNKKVKLLDFLKELQKIVMFESEIESSDGFVEE